MEFFLGLVIGAVLREIYVNTDLEINAILAIICVVLFIIVSGIFYAVYAQEVPALQEFNQEFTPPDILTSYSYKESTDWTTWNKVLFGSAVTTFGVGDILSTADGIDRGCEEMNPLFGSNPNVGVLVVGKVAAFGIAYWLLEEYSVPTMGSDARNWAYGFLTALGTFATVHNYGTKCYQ